MSTGTIITQANLWSSSIFLKGCSFFFFLWSFFSKANLELNKETLAEELVCLLDVAALPQDVAGFKRLIESFFIAGAARMDLIGEVMDLDNEIGGYNFDIPLLEETEKTIRDIGRPGGKESFLLWLEKIDFRENRSGTSESLKKF